MKDGGDETFLLKMDGAVGISVNLNTQKILDAALFTNSISC